MTATWLLYCPRFRSRSPHNAQHFTSIIIGVLLVRRCAILWSRSCIIGRAGASPPSRTAAIIFLYIYLYPCRTSCPKFGLPDNSIFLRRRCMYIATELYCRPTLSPMDSSAMDSSAIGVGVDVLVGKFMQGPWSAVPDIRSIRWYGNFPNSWLLFTN